MKPERRSLQIGAAVIVCALILRLLGSGIADRLISGLQQPQTIATLLFFSTGRMAQPVVLQLEPAEETAPETTQPPEEKPVFSPADTALLQLRDTSGCQPDLETLLQRPLSWDLTGEEPTVLILHTHGTESYAEIDGYRTEDPARNMISIGEVIAARLEAGGIRVIHDRTAHDAVSYNGSYAQSRSAAESYLAQYPSIRLVLDIHRDAMEDSSGNQIASTVSLGDAEAAQLMLVLGTDAGGQTHPNWQENLALAAKLQVCLERQTPGLCRPISLRAQRFNQDLLPGMLLVEVGAAGNTHAQAVAAAEQLAQGILTLAKGTKNPE